MLKKIQEYFTKKDTKEIKTEESKVTSEENKEEIAEKITAKEDQKEKTVETEIIKTEKIKEEMTENEIIENKEQPVFENSATVNDITIKPKKNIWFYFGLVILFILIVLGISGYFYWTKIILTSETSLKIGFTSDWEYGYKNNVGNKPTNKAPETLEKVVNYFNNQFHPEIVVVGGDLVESSISKKNTTIEQFGKINAIFSKLQAKRGYVFGNHDLRDLTKEELRNILGMDDNHSYFDLGDWRFVLMDTNFQKDGSDLGPNYYVEGLVSEAEFDWLRVALDTEKPTILFMHHPSRPDIVDGEFVANTKNLANGLELHNFLKQYKNLVLVAAGHEPGYKFDTVDGINYLVNGNLATFEVLGNFTSMDAKYNKYTKETKIAIEKHGERANKMEIKKKIGKLDWKDLIWKK